MNAAISGLDNALGPVGSDQGAGEDIVLRRVIGSGAIRSNVDVTVRAITRAFRPEELIGGISQTDSLVVLSPTQILQRQWLPVANSQYPDYPWLPQMNNKVVVKRRVRNITFVKPFIVGNEVVRIELTVAG